MSDELDRRAALAMGWTEYTQKNTGDKYWVNSEDVLRLVESWSPSTDRNDLAELLREVERRKPLAFDLNDKILTLWESDKEHHAFFAYSIIADPAIICEAACEVLEATNERN